MIALSETTATEVVQALAAERHSAGDTRGLALNLVVIVDEKDERDAEAALTVAAQEHPCRLLIVVRHREGDQPRLDAEIIVGGRLGPCEAVVMRVHGELADHAESVVMPLLAPDVPVVTCWFVPPPYRAAEDPLGAFADRRITYCSRATDSVAALQVRAEDYTPGDTDLNWTRITRWRTLIASAFDVAGAPVTAVSIDGSVRDASVVLMAGWLAARLGITPTINDTDIVLNGEHVPAVASVMFTLDNGDEVAVTRDTEGHAVLRRTGFPDRGQNIHGRTLGELLAEELRLLDPDQTYEAAMTTCTSDPVIRGAPA